MWKIFNVFTEFAIVWFMFCFLSTRHVGGILAPQSGTEPVPLHWELWVLTTGPPGRSPTCQSLRKKFCWRTVMLVHLLSVCLRQFSHSKRSWMTVTEKVCQPLVQSIGLELRLGQRWKSGSCPFPHLDHWLPCYLFQAHLLPSTEAFSSRPGSRLLFLQISFP